MRRISVAVLAASTLVLAGCGDAGTDATGKTSATASDTSSSSASSTSSTSSSTSTTTAASTSASSTRTTDPDVQKPSGTEVPRPTTSSKPEPPRPAPPGTTKDACVPTKLSVKSIGLSDNITSMGLNAQGQIYPPAKVTMWYNRSPLVGANGISVIAGHVEYDGPDDFYNLDTVSMGTPVEFTCANGKVQKWKVSAKESVNKVKLQSDARVWGSSATPVVALITCDRHSEVQLDGHLKNNFVVWVRPA